MAGSRKKLQSWWRGRNVGGQARPERPERPNAAPAALSARGSNDIQQDRSGDSVASLVNHQESPATQSLWDRAYDALAKKNTELVKEYKKLLAKDEQTTSSASRTEPPIQPVPPRDVTCGPDCPSRQAQLNAVIEQGLRRMEGTKPTYNIAGHEFVLTDQITQAANLLLWAKDWINDAVQASPQASIAWAGVCLILPLLTNPTTAAEASLDGFADVTTRMRYYVALEPLLRRLGQNAGVALMSEAEDHIIDLYQHILEFQICCVLRFYQSRIITYVHDMFSSKDWKQATLDIKAREATVNKDLSQINELATREELEALNKTSIDALRVMKGLLSVSTQQLAVSKQQLAASTQQSDVLQEQLVLQQDAVRQKLSDEQKKCLQLFCLTRNDNDATYEWYKDRVEDRIQGTCQWFLQHNHFQRWLAQESGPLLVSADPGCGKSVLAKYLIDRGLAQRAATICYFFFKDQDQNTTRQALCALLHQLFSQKEALIQNAMELYNTMGPALIQSKKSLWTILGNAVRDPQAGPVIIVLDALDECAESEFEDLIRNIESQFRGKQSGNASLKFLLTSRPYKQILSKFQGLLAAFPYIRIPGEEDSETIRKEVNHVILHRVGRLANEEELSDKVKHYLAERLLRVEHRTYLWVYLVFDYLKKGFKKTPKGIEAAIQTLPESVNQAYERILAKSWNDPIVQKVLSIILAVNRPLTLSEMSVAVNVNDQTQTIYDLDLEEEANFKSHLRSGCGLFVSIHHGRVYFLHQTAREFLTDPPSSVALSSELRWQGSITTRHAHSVLAEICVFYLNMFNSEKKGASSHDNDRGAFLDYSANNWAFHLHEADIETNSVMVPLASGLCDPDSTSHSMWSTIYCKTSGQFIPEYFTGLLVASFFGLLCVVELLLDEGADVGAKDLYGWTPLSLAAEGGHEAVVRLLLDEGADVDTKDQNGWMPLSFAARRGYEAITRLLLDKGADVGAKDLYGWTPLSLAAEGGHEAVVRLLLDEGADVEANGNISTTPLSFAAEGGHEAVVQLLLDKGADVEAKDLYNRTPLSLAAEGGYEAVVQLLLDKGADVDTKDQNGWMPLSFAARRGYEAITRLLLDKGADAEAKDKYNRTPLLIAAKRGDESVVRLLLDKGADVEVKGNDSNTPLSCAAWQGYEAVVRLLLDKGADIEAKDRYNKTPLSSAAWLGHEAVVRLLLDKGADIEAKDQYNRTPLSRAVYEGHEAVVRLLLDKGADIEAKDQYGVTPLSFAAGGGHEAVVRLLLDKSADVDTKDQNGWTPLSFAARRGYKAITRLLLDKGADAEAKISVCYEHDPNGLTNRPGQHSRSLNRNGR